ncbi:MAG: hypothetical protein N2491_13420 [Negativicutes bacterium]|nr:hypothetical protein [Negativicutes bacterium]
MNKNKKWFLAIGMATMLAANGLVMAADTQDRQDEQTGKRPAAAARSEFGKKGGMKGFHGDNKALVEFLKLDEQSFKAARQQGKTLAQIAKEQGIAEQDLKDFLVKQMTANIEQRVTDMINGKAPMRGHGPKGHAPFASSQVLELLKLDKETLKTEMKNGKTLATIAQEQGVSEQELKDVLVKEMNRRIEEGVKAGRIPVDKAEQMQRNAEQRVADMINGKAPMHKQGQKPQK